MFEGGLLLLGASSIALLAAGWRLAGLATVVALERALVAATFAASAAVAEALLLGRVGAGGSTAALLLAAVATWLVVRATTGERPSGAWWSTLGRIERWAIGAAFGALALLTLWLMHHPVVGIDATVYHLPEALGWVHHGNTGTTPVVQPEFQTGSYPLTYEVLLAWSLALAHSFAPAELWTAVALVLLTLGGWVGLRRLGCGRGLTVLALAALLTEPVLSEHVNKPKNDLLSLAWLAVCLGLCAASVPGVRGLRMAPAGRPALLGPALAAAGLGVGCKTTVAPLAVLGLAAAAWACRGTLRTALRPIAAGAVAAVAVGGVWYLRNLVAHGWPFWPFSSGPFGDAVPSYLRRIDVTFLQRPRATLQGRTGIYASTIGGGLVLIGGGILSPLLARRRPLVLGAAAATAVAAVAWMVAPFTGRADNAFLDLSLTTVRYLLPVVLAGAATLALAGRTSRIAIIVLAAALVWNVNRMLRFGYPNLPSVWVPLAGAAVGLLVAVLVGRGRTRGRLALMMVAVLSVVTVAGAADGWVARAGATNGTPAAPLEAWFAALPGWSEDRAPVAFSMNIVGPVAGDRLRHGLALIPGDESCAKTVQRTRGGWVVVRDLPPFVRALLAPVRAPECLAGLRPVAHPGEWAVYHQGG